MHDPKAVRFKWLQSEEEGEAISMLSLVEACNGVASESISNNCSITVIAPSGKPFTIGQKVKTLDFTSSKSELLDGSLCAFKNEDGETYVAVWRKTDLYFLGYAKLLNPQAESIRNRIQFIADGSSPAFLVDDNTKNLVDNDIVLIGKQDRKHCAINIYQINYSSIKNNNEVSTEGYCGAGTLAQTLNVNTDNLTPIVIQDNSACFYSKYAQEYYETADKIADIELKSVIVRIATLMDLMAKESGGDMLFDNYKKFVSCETNPHYFGDSQLWGGSIDDYKIFEKALHSYLYSKTDLEEMIVKCDDNAKLTEYAWLYWYKYRDVIKTEIRNTIISKLARDEMHGNAFFGNGQEYLVVKYIETIPHKQKKTAKRLFNSYSRIIICRICVSTLMM